MANSNSSEMMDLGHTMDQGNEVAPATATPRKEMMYPSVTLCTKELPDLEGASVEDQFEFHGVLEVVGVNEDEYTRGTEVRLHVLKGSVSPIKTPHDDTTEEDVKGIQNAKKSSGDHMNQLMESDMEDQ